MYHCDIILIIYAKELTIVLATFIIVSFIISIIDIKKEIIPDAIVLPAIIILAAAKFFEGTLQISDFVAIAILVVLFALPIFFNMAFGGGDLRFGAFAALFVGLEGLGFFILYSGLIHLVVLSLLKKKSFAFAPSMSLAALLAYITVNYAKGVLF